MGTSSSYILTRTSLLVLLLLSNGCVGGKNVESLKQENTEISPEERESSRLDGLTAHVQPLGEGDLKTSPEKVDVRHLIIKDNLEVKHQDKNTHAEVKDILPESSKAVGSSRATGLGHINLEDKNKDNYAEALYKAMELTEFNKAPKGNALADMSPFSEDVLANSGKLYQKALILEEGFPWPPPIASAMARIPNNFFRRASGKPISLADIDSHIKLALDTSGYFERSYYSIPEGFALITRIEKINPDGTPKPGNERWSIKVGQLKSFTLGSYLKALFTSDPGYFRIIAFVVTSHPFTQASRNIQFQEAKSWLNHGWNKLPPEVKTKPYTEQHSSIILIYEFEKTTEDEIARAIIPGRLSGRAHLEKSEVWSGLQH